MAGQHARTCSELVPFEDPSVLPRAVRLRSRSAGPVAPVGVKGGRALRQARYGFIVVGSKESNNPHERIYSLIAREGRTNTSNESNLQVMSAEVQGAPIYYLGAAPDFTDAHYSKVLAAFGGTHQREEGGVRTFSCPHDVGSVPALSTYIAREVPRFHVADSLKIAQATFGADPVA